MALIPEAPAPLFVMAPDGVRIATYDAGDPSAPVVLAVHGFASSAYANWFATGWIRELLRAGYRVVAVDQRGHGRSDKPHDPAAYAMELFVADVHTVLDTYLLDEVGVVGYSLGARVAWHAALGSEHRITRAVLGGIPDGRPLTRFRVHDARAHIQDGAELGDRLTRAYIDMARRSPDNDLAALIALVEGMQDGLQPDPAVPPLQPVLFATGSEDGILEASKRLAAATPRGEFFEIPGRNHFNAPTARSFRDRAVAFLGDASGDAEPSGSTVDPHPLRGADDGVTAWTAGLAALLMNWDDEERERPGSAELEALLERRWDRWTRSLQRAAARSRTGPGSPGRPA